MDKTLVIAWLLFYPVLLAIVSFLIDRYVLRREVKFISIEAHFGRALVRGLFLIMNCWMANNWFDFALVFSMQGLLFVGVFDSLMSKLLYNDWFAIGGTSFTDRIKKSIINISNENDIRDILQYVVVLMPSILSLSIHFYIRMHIDRFNSFTIFLGY